MKTNQGFNVFEILSASDQELVHSAMFRFFIQNSYLSKSFFSFLGFPLKSIGNTELEKSYSFIDKNGNKRKLRFDLLVTESSNKDKPVLVVENKFKATPTAGQLALYDDYFSSANQNKVKKVLFVFSFEQISLDVNKYCEKNNWTIRSYIPEIFFDNETKERKANNLLEWLVSVSSMNVFDEKTKLLLDDYHEYLKCYDNKIRELAKKPIFLRYAEVERFTYFQYMLLIQRRISEGLYNVGFNNIAATNDGGKNVIPGIAFWMPIYNTKLIGIISAYAAIDGSTFKLGISYDKSECINVNKNIEFLSNNFNTSFKTLNCTPNNRNIKKSDEGKKSESVHSVYTFEILENQPLDIVLDEIVDASVAYFNNLKNANSI